MKRINLTLLFCVVFICCKKNPVSVIPPKIISIHTASVSNETLSIYYIDSASNNKVPLKIRPQQGDFTNAEDGYGFSIATGNFISHYIWDACYNNGIKNFKIEFVKAGVKESHDWYIDFKKVSSPGVFTVTGSTIDGKGLTALPLSDSLQNDHYETGFIYNRP